MSLAHHLGRFREQVLVHVAKRDNLDGRDLDEPKQIALAVPTRADKADAFGFLVEEFRAVGAQGRESQRGRGALQEAAATDHERDRGC